MQKEKECLDKNFRLPLLWSSSFPEGPSDQPFCNFLLFVNSLQVFCLLCISAGNSAILVNVFVLKLSPIQWTFRPLKQHCNYVRECSSCSEHSTAYLRHFNHSAHVPWTIFLSSWHLILALYDPPETVVGSAEAFLSRTIPFQIPFKVSSIIWYVSEDVKYVSLSDQEENMWLLMTQTYWISFHFWWKG